jgi:hypothetical protein
MTKKNNNLPKILAIVAGVLLLGALVYVFGFTSITSEILGGRADRAIAKGRIEISSYRDFDKYFVFLPAEEVTALLGESEEKFLFPQIDLGLAEGKSFTVEEKEVQREGDVNPINFVTVSGLPEDTGIYSSGVGLVRGSVVPGSGVSYAWSKEALIGGDDNGVILIYFPAVDLGTADSNPFMDWVESEAYSSIEDLGGGYSYAKISVPGTIPDDFIPGGVSLAAAIAKDGEAFTDFSLDKILTYKGRIVMRERFLPITAE